MYIQSPINQLRLAGVLRVEPGLRGLLWGSLLSACCTLLPAEAQSQENDALLIPTTNPRAFVRQQVAATDIEITYHRPRVKGREIFGALVPWGQVWRTGAEAATRISFSTPVFLDDTRIEAGTYEMFTLPGRESWTVILQNARQQWGSYSYDPAHDVARIPADVGELAHQVESFTIAVDDVLPSSARLVISWDHTRVSVPIRVDIMATAVPRIEEILSESEGPPYFRAAMFYFENDLNYARAADLMARALEANPGHIGMLHRLALILEKKGDVDGAIAAAEASLEGARSANSQLRDEYTRLNEPLLARLRERRNGGR